MKPGDGSFLDTEGERRLRLAELRAEHGGEWEESFLPGSFGCHELLDRTQLAAEMVEEWILSHPACVRERGWFALAAEAVTALQALYQEVGAVHLEAEEEG